MPPKYKMQLDKAAWSWTETTQYTEVKEEHVKMAYRLNLTTCERGSCKRNCKGNPFCLNNMGEKKWFTQLDESKFQQFNPEETRRQEGNFVGLKNLGATCYVNTFLQLWFHDPIVRKAVYQWLDSTSDQHYVEGWKPDSICGHLQLIFALMQGSRRCYVDPSPLIECLGLDAGEQQDAQEFSKLFLHVLESALSGDIPGKSNVIEQQFCGKYCYVTICQNCGSHSETPATFYELDLNIRGHSSLTASIKDFLQEEKLEGDNQYMCSHCNSKQNATRAIQLKKLPPVLNLQLLRFVFDKNKGHKKKLSSFIQFPETLDMNPYLRDGEEATYNLVAVLIHSGSTAHSGHYIAHIKERESGVWYKFNDEDIEKMKNRKLELGKEDDTLCAPPIEGSSEKTPKLAKGIHSSRNAYMLVYSRCQGKAAEGAEPSFLPLSMDLLPDTIRGYVEKDNQDFENWIEERLRDQTETIANKKQVYDEMRYLYTSLPVKTLSEPWEWITTEWLAKWLNDPPSVSKVSNNVPKCQHGKIQADEVVRLKCISEAAASCMFAKYPVDRRFNGPSMLCETCIRQQCRTMRFQSCMAEDEKLFNSTKNGKNNNNRNSMSLDSSEEQFWVSTKHLRSWKRFALQNMTADEFSMASQVISSTTTHDSLVQDQDTQQACDSPDSTTPACRRVPDQSSPLTTQQQPSPDLSRLQNGSGIDASTSERASDRVNSRGAHQWECDSPCSTTTTTTASPSATVVCATRSNKPLSQKPSSPSSSSPSSSSPSCNNLSSVRSTTTPTSTSTPLSNSSSPSSSSENSSLYSHHDHTQVTHSSNNNCQCAEAAGKGDSRSKSSKANKADHSETTVIDSSPTSCPRCSKSGSSEQDSGKDTSFVNRSENKHDSMDEAVSSETCESPDSGIIVLKTTMRDFCDNEETADLLLSSKSSSHGISNDKTEGVEDEDNGDDEMNDGEDRNEVFNSDMLCEHGNLRVDETGRRLVKREVWDRLLYYFPHLEPFTLESPICQSCLESLQFEHILKQTRKQAGQGQKDVLQDLYHSRNRPKMSEPWAGRSAFVVSANFLDGWRKFVKHSVKLDSDLEIVNAPLLCEHDLLLYDIEDMNATDSSARFTLVWDEEWLKLVGYFNFDVKIEVNQCFNVDNGKVNLNSKPDVCVSCLCERIRQEEEGKFVFSAQTIYVRKVNDGQKYHGRGDADGDGKSKGYNYDPEFSAPPPEKMAKMESISQRKSSRHRKTRGEKEVVVSSGMTLKELKIKLCPLFSIAPFDQNLSLDGRCLKGDEITLQEFRFYPQCVVSLTADEPSAEVVVEQEDFMNAPSRPEEGFKGTNLMGR